jgi:hypothetical protein
MAWTTPGTATAGEVLTATRWNTDVRDNTTHLFNGLGDAEGFIVSPTSVVNATATGGEITFSNAATVSVNGCFSSGYDQYRLFIFVSGSADTTLQLRMRLSGTDASAGAYGGYGWYFSTGGGTSGALWSQTSSATSMRIADISGGKGKTHCTIMAPAMAEATFASGFQYDPANTDGGYWFGVHTTATAYDGFTIFGATGNITGTLRVYGVTDA